MRWLIIPVALLVASSAQATPPRVQMTDDQLIAATQTHIYVSRDVSDNRGSHYSELVDQRLIEIALDGGTVTGDWLIRSFQVDRLNEAGDPIEPGIVTERAAPENLHAILADKAAAAVAMRTYFAQVLEFNDTGDLIHRDTGVVLTFDALRAVAEAQILPMMAAYPEAPSEETHMQADRIEPFALPDGAWACELPAGRYVLTRPAASDLRLIKVVCEPLDDIGRFSFHLILPNGLWD